MIDLDALQSEMTSWRRDLHRHPEFGFEEKRTAAFVAAMLRDFGLDEVVEGVGGTGVVATLKALAIAQSRSAPIWTLCA